MGALNKVLGGTVAVGAGVLAWSLLEARSYVVRQYAVPALAPGSKPIRVLHVSDLHMTPGQTRRTRWVRSLARYRPDVVVNTGDNLGHVNAVPAALEALDPLLEFPGVFVHGSNDFYGPRMKNPLAYVRRTSAVDAGEAELDTESLTRGFTSAGWLDLNNARGELELSGTKVSFVGLADAHMDRDRLPAPSETDVDDEASLRIGVTHAPYARALGALRADGASVLLAGHTHGGQVRVPGYGALTTNSDLETQRARGVHGWPGPRPDVPGGETSAWLHVSAGVGTSPYTPVRLACRPEATMLTLLPREA